ncbi:hypothetical protein [Neolewinella antarctica]|uniref:PNPLA domain-containing protein n=1 Tax=Neolewinella antarctica TaxID=442734 RepID=A0ABX0XED2_9BACT|nr:hypothetical protein [Neolewinella antarctica]NJC27455.1 hypothetical protein [Neolewinella antarctica]
MQASPRSFLRSFPVQLLLLHARRHFMLLLVWALFVLMMSGYLGRNLGLQYLFLDPEYLNVTGFWSFLIIGLAYGYFVMSWNLSTYLLLGGYFNFLASLSRPFFKFCINNALLPLGILLLYCLQIGRFFRLENNYLALGEALTGLLLGLTISLFIYALYFNLTNRDISYYRPKFRDPPPNMGPSRTYKSTAGRRPYRTRGLGPKLSGLYDNPYRVETYVNEKLKSKLVRSVAHYESSLLQGIFRQNHTNALLLQVGTIVLLAVLGILIDRPVFQIPAGASFLILFSLVVSIIGAISYWFSEWRVTLLILFAVGVNALTSSAWLAIDNQAYGLDYDAPPAAYSLARINGLYGSQKLTDDIAATTEILNNWKANQPDAKPPFIVVCASGGGLTAALWTTHVAQTLDRCSEGAFLRGTALMTGASGGQIGLAALREAYLSDPDFREREADRIDRISRDLLNPIAFSIVSNDLFLPFARVDVMGRPYRRDRAYGFERELNLNTGGLLEKPLAAYREPERLAQIPLMFITPSVVDDGRRMVISPQGVSYMSAPPLAMRGEVDLEPDMVDFRWLLAGQDADNLSFLTALRMNATYPYVLPLVRLPTVPAVRLMDAGYRDNYGIVSAARFLTVFQDWIRENTSGVHVVQISAFRENEPAADEGGRRGVVESLFSPVGVAGNILGVQILDQEAILGQLTEIIGPDFFHLHRFNYQPALDDPLRTSVSFHMTERERVQVLRALDSDEMKSKLDEVVRILGR